MSLRDDNEWLIQENNELTDRVSELEQQLKEARWLVSDLWSVFDVFNVREHNDFAARVDKLLRPAGEHWPCLPEL